MKGDNLQEVRGYSAIDAAIREHRAIVSVEHDADILGATAGQALILLRDIPEILQTQWDDIFQRINLIAFKLGAVRYHFKNYEQSQTKRHREILADETTLKLIKQGLMDCERDMDYEFEAWLHQIKASLDLLIQIFLPILGSKTSEFPKGKYGDKGNRVITLLNQKKKHTKVVQELNLDLWKIDGLIGLIEAARDGWITSIVKLRDDITHRAPYIRFGFTWDTAQNRLKEPMANEEGKERPMLEIIEQVTEILIDYSRSFIALTLSCRKPREVLRRPLNDIEKRYHAALWELNEWDMDINSVRWVFTDTKAITEADLEQALSEITSKAKDI